MSDQTEALRLADAIDPLTRKYIDNLTCACAANELRRLHEANEASGKRQEWWNERMFELEKQRDELLEVLKHVRAVFPQDRWADDTKKMLDVAIARAEGKAMNHREVMQQALEAIEDSGCKADLMAAADALRAALAEPTGKPSLQVEPQEPVAWINSARDVLTSHPESWGRENEEWVPLYTHHAPQRQPLTREEIRRIVNQTVQGVTIGESVLFLAVARAVEKAHGIGGRE